jgi:competence protein ComEC
VTRPALVAVGAVAAALAGGLLADRPAAVAISALVAVLAAIAGFLARRPAAARAGAVALGVAVVLGRILVGALAAPPPADPGDAAGRTAWAGRVVSVSAPAAGRQRFVVETDDGGVRLEVRAPRFPEVATGSRVQVTGDALPPRDDAYGRSLASRGIAATLLARSLRVDPPDAGIGAVFGWLRGIGDASLRAAVPEPAGGLGAGILLGLRERVDRAVAADFTTTGLSHVVAISGWNIAIVVVALGILLRRLSRRPRTLLTLLAVCVYVGVVGATPPVVRAALMAGIVLLARETGRHAGAAAALAWAVVAMLVADPASVDDPGFRLSSAATAGLLAWGTPMTARIGAIGGGRMPGWIAETLGVSLAAQAATLPLVLVGFGRLSLISPAANLLVAPLVAPAMGAGAIALAGGTATVAGLPPVIAALLGVPAWVGFGAIILAATVAARVPFACVTLAAPWDTVLAGLAAVGLVVIGSARGRAAVVRLISAGRSRLRTPRSGAAAAGSAAGSSGGSARPAAGRSGAPTRPVAATAGGGRGPGRRPPPRGGGIPWPSGRRARLAATALAIAVAGVALGATRLPDGHPRIVVLDVGQGDAILVEDGHGARILVDGGPDPDRLVAALDERVPPWDRRIDAVVVTHPHDDHAGGLPGLIGRYAIGRVIESGMPGTGPGVGAWHAALAGHRIAVAPVATGDAVRVGGVRLRVLWPDRDAVPAEPSSDGRVVNDSSIVLLGDAGGARFLLSGDAEDDVDARLVARGLPRVALYKVAHHGSRTASSDALLAALAPSVAVISVGADNSYGHPSPETIARLVAHGARVFRTDRDGTVTATISGGRVEVHGDRAAASVAGPGGALLYHRLDDSSRPDRGSRAPALPRPAALVPPARARGRGDRGMARRARGRRGRRGGPAPRRVCRAPPRRGQARRRARRVRHRPRHAARRGLRGLARGPRPRGARPGGGLAPGDAAGGRRRVRDVARDRRPGGADRGVRRQARGPAARIDGGAVRVVGTPLPAARRRDRVGSRRHRGDPGAGGAARGGRVRPRGDAAGRGRAAAVDGTRVPGRARHRGARRRGRRRDGARGRAAMTGDAVPVALIGGDDAFGLEREARAFGDRIATEDGTVLRTVRVSGTWRRTAEAEEKAGAILESVATGSLFGDGALVIAADAPALARSESARATLLSAIRSVAPGNVLVLLSLVNDMGRQPAGFAGLRTAVVEAGGAVVKVDLPRDLVAWIRQTGPALGAHLDGPAAQELARRIGALERGGDLDRRALASTAAAELEKLALYRPDGEVTVADVALVVAERLPASLFRLVDAIGARRAPEAVALLDRAAATTPPPVLVVRIHRRLRDIAIARDLAARGEPKIAIARALGWLPATPAQARAGGEARRAEPDLGKVEWRVDRILDEARRWTDEEVAGALDGLLAADAAMKGERSSSERAQRLELALWVVERVAQR